MKTVLRIVLAFFLTFAIVVIGSYLFPKIATTTNNTNFLCINNQLVTVAEQDKEVSEPMIQWNTDEFGDKFTPQKRCQVVSNKFNETVNKNGGRLSNLTFTTGIVNGYDVVCAVKNPTQDSCNDRNMLFTLNTENSQNPKEILEKIAGFSLKQNGDNVIYENGNGLFVSLEGWVKTLEFKKPY